MNSSFNYINGQ